jgi:acyl-CoA thioesterase-2
MNFKEMMHLDRRGPDSYVGEGPSYPWGGLFGGQIVAQSLVAAAATVDPLYVVHSLHAYFIRRGDASQPIRFDVDRLRDGRSFVTRSVVASQSAGAILNMSASFQAGQVERYLQTHPMPEAAPPEDLSESGWGSMLERRKVRDDNGRATAWLRARDSDGDDWVLSAAALAYLSDDLATDSVRSAQQTGDEVSGRHWSGTSLDHAIWFHHRVPDGEWQLHDFRCEGVGAPRGLAAGHVFDRRGTHLATVSQEVLLRPIRDGV